MIIRQVDKPSCREFLRLDIRGYVLDQIIAPLAFSIPGIPDKAKILKKSIQIIHSQILYSIE